MDLIGDLEYTNRSSSYIDDFTLRFIVESLAKTDELSAVPEPSVAMLVLLGAALLGFRSPSARLLRAQARAAMALA